MKHIFFIIAILIIHSCGNFRLSQYKSIKKTYKRNVENCEKEKYFVNSNPLTGKYKLNYDKSTVLYGTFKNGYYSDVVSIYKKKKLWIKENYNREGDLTRFAHYQNRAEKNKNYDDSDVYQKYDSAITHIKDKLPSESFFYNGEIKHIVKYSFRPQELLINTDIENFKIEPDHISFNIIENIIFSKCKSNIFTYNTTTDQLFDNIYISIESNKQIKKYTYFYHKDLNDYSK